VPNLTRRAVLVLGAAAGAVAALPGTASARVGVRRPRASLPGRSHYAPGLGKAFHAVGADGRTYRMTLVTIADVTHLKHVASVREHAFNLLFKPVGAVPPDGIYRLTSAHAVTSSLFISGVGPHGAARRIQALVVRGS
jgi:hypothetical protein